jgi:site-specific recombinase XerD
MAAVLESMPETGKDKKLLDQMRGVLRLKHYSYRTEQSYIDWVERFVRYHARKKSAQAGSNRLAWRHPREMREEEVSEFLTHLARDGNVAPSTQNQALSALLFLYKHVLKVEIAWLTDVERATKPKRIPVVLTRDEVHRLFAHLHGRDRLMAGLLYGSGLRLMECIRLRVHPVR